ncbi:MAG TPA: hypothetical protein PKN23_02605 [Candidatus Hydrogenedentes bacterium]|nr:hypothetical protein [Candidatus Hydrogenedentota bacterium]
MLSAALIVAAGALALAQPSISTRELAPPPGMNTAPAAPAAPAAAPSSGELREIGTPPAADTPSQPAPTPSTTVVVEEAAPVREEEAAPKKPEPEKKPPEAPRAPAEEAPSPKQVKKTETAPRETTGGRRVAAFWVILPRR